MKICFLAHDLDTKNGGGRFASDLIFHIQKSGHEVFVLTGFKTDEALPYKTENLLKRYIINFLKIRKIFKNSDVIHVIDVWPYGFYACVAAIGLSKPVVVTALGTYSVSSFHSRLKPFLIWAYRRFKVVVAISDYTSEQIKKRLPDINIKIIYPGFDLAFWQENENGFKNNKEILNFKPYILSVGAVKPRKGYESSTQAFAILAQKFNNLNYVIVGQVFDQGKEAEYAQNLREIVKKENLENRVFFLSQNISDEFLKGLYADAELFLLAPIQDNNQFEGFGLVYLEAAAAGLPIVATYQSGAESATKDRFNSILVPPDHPRLIAAAITEILSDKSFGAALGSHSRQWAQKFSWEEVIKSYVEIYKDFA